MYYSWTGETQKIWGVSLGEKMHKWLMRIYIACSEYLNTFQYHLMECQPGQEAITEVTWIMQCSKDFWIKLVTNFAEANTSEKFRPFFETKRINETFFNWFTTKKHCKSLFLIVMDAKKYADKNMLNQYLKNNFFDNHSKKMYNHNCK